LKLSFALHTVYLVSGGVSRLEFLVKRLLTVVLFFFVCNYIHKTLGKFMSSTYTYP